jgi:hypothetical protein
MRGAVLYIPWATILKKIYQLAFECTPDGRLPNASYPMTIASYLGVWKIPHMLKKALKIDDDDTIRVSSQRSTPIVGS